MEFKPTKDQNNAISAAGTVLVSAAAGSGKTAVLVERVIRLLMDKKNPIDADKLLIVTFTNAAAAEMRQRLEKRLAAEIEKNPLNPRLLRQQLLISGASICTIDSFCIDLVRDHFYALNIEPDFKIADPSAVKPIREEVATALLDREYGAGDEIFYYLMEMLGADYGDGNLMTAILRIYEFSRSMPFPAVWLDKTLHMYEKSDKATRISEIAWADTILGYVKRELRSISDLIKATIFKIEHVDYINEKYLPSLADGLDKVNKLYVLACEKDWDGLYAAIDGFAMKSLATLRGFDDAGLINLVKSNKKSAQDRIKKLSKIIYTDEKTALDSLKEITPALKLLIRLVKEFGTELAKEMSRRNMLGFDDVEHLALSLLVEEHEGDVIATAQAAEIKNRFAEVLVDEYQDTNHLQDTLFYALSDNGRRLFMVGDVKQSIYRFRRANPEIFLSRKNTYPLYDGIVNPSKIILGSNFRSREGVCDYVNFFFSCLMSTEAGEMEYGEEDALIPQADYQDNEAADVDLHVITAQSDEDNREQTEAKHIASYIKEVIAAPPHLKDKDFPERRRAANYGDFTILLRSPSNKIVDYVSELEKQNIPVWADVGGFLETTEIMTILSLLQTIDNPARDIPLLSVMFSGIFGFTADEIAGIRINAKAASGEKRISLYGAVIISADKGDQKCIRFLEKLRFFRSLAVTLPVDQLLEKLYDITAYTAVAGALSDGRRRRANLILLIEYARSLGGTDSGGLTGFLRMMEKLKQSNGLKSASAAEDGSNAVKIMSIHASKGLQFPICILAACSKGFNKEDKKENPLLHETGGMGFRVYNDKLHTRNTTIARNSVSIKIDEESLAEELRLCYVAMTRAEEKLVLIVSEKDTEKTLRRIAESIGDETRTAKADPAFVLSANGYADWALMTGLLHPGGKALREMAGVNIIPAKVKGHIEVRVIDEIPEGAPEDKHPVKAFTKGNARLMDEISKRFNYKYPFERLNTLSAKAGVSELSHRALDESYAFSARPAFLSKSGLTPAERGTAVHKFMQYADYGAAEKNAAAELTRLNEYEFLSDEEADAVDTRILQKFFSSAVYARMKNSQRVMREIRFLNEIPAVKLDPSLPKTWEETVVVQGVADCVFVEENQLVILDFKTDRVSDSEKLKSMYSGQLRIYAEALSKNYDMPVKECLLYSFYNGCEIPLDFSLDLFGLD